MSTDKRQGKLFYHRLPEFSRKDKKLDFLKDSSLRTVNWRRLTPNQSHTWLTTDTEDEFDSYLPIGSKEAKRANHDQAETVFKTYSGGVKTNRDQWVFDFAFDPLAKRMRRFVEDYNAEVDRYKWQVNKPAVDEFVDYDKLKWDGTLKNDLHKGNHGHFELSRIRRSSYRPYTKKCYYFDGQLSNSVYLQPYFFPDENSETENQMMWYKVGVDWPQYALMVNNIPDLMPQSGSQCFPFYTYDEDGSNRRENITDYALDLFRSHYHDPAISKWDIFYYVYGLLHHPGYRQRYALDLKRNLPRIPFAPPTPNPSPTRREGLSSPESSSLEPSSPSLILGNIPREAGDRGGAGAGGWGQENPFQAFSRAGQQLAELHLNYESVERYPLDWQATRQPIMHRVEKMLPKGKVNSSAGNYKVYETLRYNGSLTLHGIPKRAFAYRLGNRSALDWIVDQYRVKTDKRSGITHDPNGYSDDPQYILKLIERVITVSLRTVDIVDALAKLPFRAE